jgi:hypothetical protein
MVTVLNYVERKSSDGRTFNSLILQGGVEPVLSEQSGRYYRTSRQASVTTTLDEKTCQNLIGTQLRGRISRIQCDPYEFAIPETGEVITLTHRWVYNPNEAAVDEMVYEKAVVEDPFAL